MEYHVGLEDMEPGNWVAWVFELPGCYARGSAPEQALDGVPTAIHELLTRLGQASGVCRPHSVVVQERFRAYPNSPDYLVNAFFDNDRIPLADADLGYAERVLDLNRRALDSLIADLSGEILTRTIPGEVQGNIGGILRHIGTAEWWYWDRLGLAFPREERPTGLPELLEAVRRFTLQNLPNLKDSSLSTTCSGEQWSPRKLLRRTIWHERVHTLQIARYLDRLETGER